MLSAEATALIRRSPRHILEFGLDLERHLLGRRTVAPRLARPRHRRGAGSDEAAARGGGVTFFGLRLGSEGTSITSVRGSGKVFCVAVLTVAMAMRAAYAAPAAAMAQVK